MEIDEMFAVSFDLCPELDIHSIEDEDVAQKALEEHLLKQHAVTLGDRPTHTFSEQGLLPR